MHTIRTSAALLTAAAALACGDAPQPAGPGEAAGRLPGSALGARRGGADDDRTQFFVASARVDVAAETAVLPLQRGRDAHGGSAFYVVTESSDREDAERRGVNFSPKLANALGSAAVQRVTAAGSTLTFAGTVDFAPALSLVAGPSGFPPAAAEPGSVGDGAYSPLVTTGNLVVLNAPQVANASGVHDKVVAIDTIAGYVTLRLSAGFYDRAPVLYLSTEASDRTAAALENATYAPNLNAAPGLGSNDRATSARSGIVPVVNGATGANNPDRQGLVSALRGEGGPLNVIQEHPENGSGTPTYSPLWDVHPAVWTDAAIAGGVRERLTSFGDIARAVNKGWVVSGGTGPKNTKLDGLRAAGFLVNCPMFTLQGS